LEINMNKSLTRTMGFLLSGALLLPAAEAMAAPGDIANGPPATVDYFTAAQQQKAFKTASAAGFTPTLVEMFQDGNFFLTAGKNGVSYEVTVVPSGQVYPSTPITPMS
jgi:ABC-type sugar transport system substrate-binding protein